MRRKKIPLKKVQEAFNAAIKRRDMRCMVQDYEPCCGSLECSHFYTVGSSPSLRFYPPNAYAQCQKHHWNHHNKRKPFYSEWMWLKHTDNYLDTDELKAEIIRLCNADKLDELKELIETELRR